ncbi:hypothetical protein [Qipengyuania sediminis]|uniref:hypothetical protein n=1 Tax=Qipengyuania sediminis TaxID=1532023 RepID=UPI001059F9DF|nr:hypothetical protein [Qipengyuania sediminis]
MQDTATDPWGIVLILGPILLIGVMIWAWLSNRKAAAERGESALGTTNAVQGSENARPDIEAEVDRARAGEEDPNQPRG